MRVTTAEIIRLAGVNGLRFQSGHEIETKEQLQSAVFHALSEAVERHPDTGGVYSYLWQGGPIRINCDVPELMVFWGYLRFEDRKIRRLRAYDNPDVLYITDKGKAEYARLAAPAWW